MPLEKINPPDSDSLGGHVTENNSTIPSAELSAREVQVLVLWCNGRSIKQSAWTLNISAKTIEFHRARIRRKTGVYETPNLVRYAAVAGYITLQAG
jgi:DNA-binding CsgD family transcriptional regulator